MPDVRLFVCSSVRLFMSADYFNQTHGGGAIDHQGAPATVAAAARHAREQEASRHLRALVVHAVFCACVVVVGVGAVDPSSYGVHRAAVNMYAEPFRRTVSA